MSRVPLRWKGGAVIPLELGWYYTVYPWAWLEFDRFGVTVGDSFGFLTLFGQDRWTVGWADLDGVEIAALSVRLVPRQRRSCRFYSFSGTRILEIEEAAQLQGVATDRVFTTNLLYSWLRRRWRKSRTS